MKFKNLGLAGLLIASSFLVNGCSQRIGDFTVISTKNMELGQKYVRTTLDGTKAVGIDAKPIIVIIPLGQPNVKEAVDKALEKNGADVLTDVVVYYDTFYIPYIYGETKYRVEGTAWKRANELSQQLESDLKAAKQLYVAKDVNGKTAFVEISKDDPIVKTVK